MTVDAAFPRRAGASAIASTIVAAVFLMLGSAANAAIVAGVPMGTAAEFAVLGASTVTNTGNTVLNGSLGVWAGTAITGFPPGQVVAPGTIEAGTGAAQQAQADLTTAYSNAAARPVTATTASSELASLTLVGGVYSGPAKSPLTLNGTLTLDGANDVTSVFIFQTDSTLITGSGSTVTLINGAQECNVFWQLGSSATLGTNSDFTGNILAQESVTVNTGAAVHGRALARNGAVTLDTNTFTQPTCAQVNPTTTTVVPATTTTTVVPATTTTTTPLPGPTTTTSTTLLAPLPTTTTTAAALTVTTGAQGPLGPAGPVTTTTAVAFSPSLPGVDAPGATASGGGTPTEGAPTTTTTTVRTTTRITTTGEPGIPGVEGPPRTGGASPAPAAFPWSVAVIAGLVGAAVIGTTALSHTGRVRSTFLGRAGTAKHSTRAVAAAGSRLAVMVSVTALIFGAYSHAGEGPTLTFEPRPAPAALGAGEGGDILRIPDPLTDGELDVRAGPIAVPLELRIPTLDVKAPVLGVGLTSRNEMDAPVGPPDADVWRQAFWYRGSAVPGAFSTALIAGHANDSLGRPGVFAGLDRLRPGESIVVHDSRSGLDIVFSVTGSRTYSLAEAADPAVLAEIYGLGPVQRTRPQPSTDGLSHLTLITCAGTFRHGTHDHRLVVHAARVA